MNGGVKKIAWCSLDSLNRIKFPCILIILFSFVLSGCAASRLDFSLKAPSFKYAEAGKEPVPVVLGVDNFVDLRPQTRGSDNKKWIGFIPGVLWIEIDTDIPEIYTPFSPYNARPMGFNVAEALADGFSRASVFKKVIFLPEDPYSSADFRLEGILRRSLVRETGYYYGSGMYAWLTRILGLPYVSYEIELDADLRVRRLSDNKIVWTGKIKGSRTDKFHSVYDLSKGRSGKHLIAYNFASIIEDRLPFLVKEIREAVAGACQNGK